MTGEKTDFTQGSILRKLCLFMLPVLGALILQAAYGAVDLLVVGRFGSTSGLSAVSTGSQVLNLVTFVLVACLVNVAGDLLLVAGLGMDAAVVRSGFAYLKGFAPETIMTVVLFSMVGYFNGRPRRPVLCRDIVASAPSLCSARIFFHKIPPIGNCC